MLVLDKKICHNCGSEVNGTYCSNCGQKYHPTQVPLKTYLKDSIESLFDIDGRVFLTIKTLFLKPGEATKDYLEGRRVTYLPPLRVFTTVSILYFLAISQIDTTQFLFIDINLGEEELQRKFADFLQYSMFFVVPVFGFFIKWLYTKQKRFFVEGLIFSMHLHAVWFFFFGAYSVIEYIMNRDVLPEPVYIFGFILLRVNLALVFLYLLLSIKKVFGESWWKSVLTSIMAIFLYIIVLAVIAFSYIAFLGFF